MVFPAMHWKEVYFQYLLFSTPPPLLPPSPNYHHILSDYCQGHILLCRCQVVASHPPGAVWELGGPCRAPGLSVMLLGGYMWWEGCAAGASSGSEEKLVPRWVWRWDVYPGAGQWQKVLSHHKAAQPYRNNTATLIYARWDSQGGLWHPEVGVGEPKSSFLHWSSVPNACPSQGLLEGCSIAPFPAPIRSRR